MNQDLGILGRVRLAEEVDDLVRHLEELGERITNERRAVFTSYFKLVYQIGRIDGREEGAALANDLRGGGGVTSQGSASTPAEPF